MLDPSERLRISLIGIGAEVDASATMSNTSLSWVQVGAAFAALACALAASGCANEQGFVSDDPVGADVGGGGGPLDVVTEAPVTQVSGSRLYALSEYGGLSIIDLGTPDALALLGRYRTTGAPFALHLRGDTVFAVSSGRVEALDVHDPAHVAPLGALALPGRVADSRMVGDSIYVVTYEDGTCEGCQSTPNTTITSLDVLDPTNIGVVDRLRYEWPDPDTQGLWERRIAVHQDRMYVAGGDAEGGGDEGQSTIQIVDLSDPTGHLVEGASVKVRGQIEGAWQMDEQDGVLRVVGQPIDKLHPAGVPTLQTFQVTSANAITKLAELELVLPHPARLRTVRFDGDRAYAVTPVMDDPLFVLDLSDPTNPVQAGQIAMPGWIHTVKARGDRLYALGNEENAPEGAIVASLIDVADAASPTMVTRVHFGGRQAELDEEQDRLRTSFALDEPSGALFALYRAPRDGSATGDDGCGRYESGIQIIDVTASSLVARGVAASRDPARSAFVHDGRLFGVSGAVVTSFDLSNRDAPATSGEAAFYVQVNRTAVAGSNIIRAVRDTSRRLEIVPASDAARAAPLGTITLDTLGPNEERACGEAHASFAPLFTAGSLAYLVRTFDGAGSSGPQAELAIADVDDPAVPVLRSRIHFPLPSVHRGHGGVVWSGEDVALTGTAVVFESRSTQNDLEAATLEIVDVSDPDHPVRHSFALPDGAGHGGLLAAGREVRMMRWTPLPDDPDKVQFFIDVVDVSDPAAPALESINVPGSLLAWDAPGRRAITVDYARQTHTGVTVQECLDLFGWLGEFHRDVPMSADEIEVRKGTCVGMHHTLKLLEFEGGAASVVAEHAIDDRASPGAALSGDDRVFLEAFPNGLVIGGMREGSLRVEQVDLFGNGGHHPIAVSGQRVLLNSDARPQLSVLDTADLDDLTITPAADLAGNAQHVTVVGDRAICAMGPHGLQSVDLSN